MKGLLVKDFRLLLMQKRFVLMVGLLAVFMAATNNDPTFMVGFVMFLMAQFSASTVSYDEFDNGYAFLFTLPVGRRQYAASKYLFAGLLTLGSWLVTLPVALAASAVMKLGEPLQVIQATLLLLPGVLLVQAVMIPLLLKFGGEKARLVMVGMVGALFVLVYGGDKLLTAMNVDLGALMDSVSRMGVALGAAGYVALTLAALGISLRISMGIMEKKEL